MPNNICSARVAEFDSHCWNHDFTEATVNVQTSPLFERLCRKAMQQMAMCNGRTSNDVQGQARDKSKTAAGDVEYETSRNEED